MADAESAAEKKEGNWVLESVTFAFQKWTNKNCQMIKIITFAMDGAAFSVQLS